MVIELISKSMTVDDVVILDEHEFTRDLQMTSVEIIDLLCSLEEHYETEIDEAEVFPIETVGELVAFVQGATTGSA